MQRIGLEGEKTELIGSGLVNIIQLLAAVPAIMYIDQLGEFKGLFIVSCVLKEYSKGGNLYFNVGSCLQSTICED